MKNTKNISFASKENQPECQSMKATTKTMNFGKSIKFKAQMLVNESPVLKEKVNGAIQNIHLEFQDSRGSRDSRLKRANSMDEDDSTFRSKMVRFEDDQNFGDLSQISLQLSRNAKKNPSILKKTPSFDKMSIGSGTSDMGQIDCIPPKSSLKDKGGACSNQKYDKALKMLKYQNTKYFDNLFPPGGASLCYSKQMTKQFESMRWARIEDVFRNKRLVLFSQHPQNKCIITKGQYNYFQNMAIAFNSLSNSNRCLQRIFQDQKVLGLCLYYLRTNHDGIWKYSIVDDFIPVIKKRGVDVPAFLNVVENDYGQVEIWPFLLQKCLAKLYNCYECLFQDELENQLFDLTGFQCETLNLQNESAQFKFRSSMLHSQTVAFVCDPYPSSYFKQQAYAIRQDSGLSGSTYFTLDIKMKLMDVVRQQNVIIDIGDIRREFKTAKIFRIDDTYYSLGCIIKQAKNTVSMRKFEVKERQCTCILSLVQRDRKYYRNNGYEYSWVRMMLVTKDGINGYRWIDGKYQNNRIVSVTCTLEPGQYYIIINGDWKTRAFEMNLNYQGTQEIQFVRDVIEKHPRIMSQTCIDIAQRFGSFKQLNKNMCSYRHIDRQNGFLIENINNQISRPVFFHKEYPLSGSNYQLLDRHNFNEQEEGVIQIKIEPNGHFTFIAKLIYGLDKGLLDQFSFD